MKPQRYLLLLFLMAAVAIPPSFAQKANVAASLKQAKKEYAAMKYANVIALLANVAPQLSGDIDAQEMLANSYRKTKDHRNAAVWYEQLVKTSEVKPEWALSYAEVLANNQRYQEAQQWYQNYLKQVGNDKRAEDFAKSYQNGSSSFMKNKNSWRVDYTNINTSASEYAPMFYNGGLLFVSNRSQGNLSKHIFGWDQSPFSNLFFVDELSKIKIVNPDSLLKAFKTDSAKSQKLYKVNTDDTRNTSNDNRVFVYNEALLKDTIGQLTGASQLAAPLTGFVNTKYHEGPGALLPDGSLMFTRNNYFKGKASTSKDGVTRLKLFTAVAPGLDEIKPFRYNNDEYSTGHPALNAAGTLLIFASDMPGGQGGVDLYYSTRASLKDEWSKPVNMGNKVNTEGDELFPTIYQDSTLFFASTGHPGLGGLDIFQVAIKGSEVNGIPVNLGAPINSAVDDFSLIRSPQGNTGYFSSNRRGNDDIYGFEFKDFKILLKGTLSNQDNAPVANAQVSLRYKDKKEQFYTDGKGNFEKALPKDAEIQLEVARPGFARFVAPISTLGIANDTTLYQNISLKSLATTAVVTQPKNNPCDSVKLIIAGLKIYYNLDKADIRPDAEAIVDKVALLLKQYPGLTTEIASHTDSRASKAYNIELSKRRAAVIKKYLISRGIDESRISSAYYGEEKLASDCPDGVNCDEQRQQLNRRTEFKILYKGKNTLTLDCSDFPLQIN